ncbi:hypothetical protein [Streptomyces nigrescens]|uniref:Uncharacterized protein n=1 Tax=Streptomyces nigrescens TaxID=1920 RepID=A0A640TKM6_STRNI|nr:hypothetical protein [Streptomyces libani]WAT98513.1 hypothetical protein STRLI_004583 [Streptomyces libani subsp. libani]GFE24139.1 hypothetical protein Sliba_45920 [Streptomyces libani subsp. libani]GGV99988.1 hypothetical protein GCM10010500_52030 [Streptomyces libani subsp. libani]
MSNAIAAIAVLISIAALIYSRLQAIYSRRQLELGERVRKEAAEPYVVADIQPRVGGSGLLVFTVENIGPTVARDVELSVTPPLQGGERSDWDEKVARAVARKIPHLPPRRRLEWYFSYGPRLFESADLPRQYTVTVKSKGPGGPVEPLTYVIDLDVIQGMALDRETVVAKLGLIAKNTECLCK